MMLSMHMLDGESTINYDFEEKEINPGQDLVLTNLTGIHDDLNNCEF